jgi:UDP-N-acetylglucosamine 4-epimerase
MSSSILLTGGAGFIGSNLVEQLLARGDVARVRVLDNLSNGYRENVDCFGDHPKYEFVEGDIRDLDTCRAAVDGMDRVAHLAALGSVPRSVADPLTSNAVNVGGFLNMMVASRDAQRVQRFVYAASSSTYGDSPALPKVEGNEGHPLSPYAVTKAVNEHYAEVFSRVYGFHTIGLRYFNVFGPRQNPDNPYAAVIPIFCKAFIEGQPPTIFGDGHTSRDFTYVDNAVQANELALFATNLDHHQVYNVACGDQVSLNEMVDILRDISGKDLRAQYAPERAGDVKHSRASIDKITADLGYWPTVRFEEGLARVYAWYELSGIRDQGSGIGDL